MDYVYLVAGLILLFAGGESLIRGSVAAAQRLGLSALLIGITIVGFGTSAPELLVSVQAALNGSPEIAVGNVVGSNIANILLILAIGAIMYPLASQGSSVRRDTIVMLAATVLLLAVASTGYLDQPMGGLFIALIIAYVSYAYWQERRGTKAEAAAVTEVVNAPATKPLFSALFIVAGLAMLVVGANLLVTGAVSIARGIGIPEAIIGLTLVAVGTSLPELATTIVAALKRETDVILGNIIGSNIFNILSILGITAIIKPIPISSQFLTQDIPLALIVALSLGALIFFVGKVGRLAGVAYLAAYIAYTTYLFTA